MNRKNLERSKDENLQRLLMEIQAAEDLDHLEEILDSQKSEVSVLSTTLKKRYSRAVEVFKLELEEE